MEASFGTKNYELEHTHNLHVCLSYICVICMCHHMYKYIQDHMYHDIYDHISMWLYDFQISGFLMHILEFS